MEGFEIDSREYKRFVSISIYYSVDELLDEETFKLEAKAKGLNIKFEKGDLSGIISIKFETQPNGSLKEIISQLKFLLQDPFKKALQKKSKKEEIISFLKDTEYLNNFVKMTQQIAREVEAGIQSIKSIKEGLERHRKIFWETGINMLVETLTNANKEKIIDNFGKFHELIVKKFAYELYVSHQLEYGYLVLLSSEESEIKEEASVVKLEPFKELEFQKIVWNIASLGKRLEMFKDKNNDNVILFYKRETMTTPEAYLIFLKLVFLNATSGFKFIDYSLDQEEKIFVVEEEFISYNFDHMRNKLLSYDSKQAEALIQKLQVMSEASSSYIKDIVAPLKVAMKQLTPTKKRQDQMLIESHLTKTHTDAQGLMVGVIRNNPPACLNLQLPSMVIKNINVKIKRKEDFNKSYQQTLRELIKEAQEVKYQKELQEKNLQLYDAKLTTEKINRVVNLLEKLSSVVADWWSKFGNIK